MNTSEILAETNKEVRKLEMMALGAKLKLLLLILLGLVFVLFEIISYTTKEGYTTNQTVLLCSIFVSVFVFPTFLAPINYFLPGRLVYAIKSKLKLKLIEQALTPYSCDLKLFPKVSLDEYLLFKKGIMRKSLKGAYGDDFMRGTFNNHPVNLSEYHVTTFFKRYFDGFLIIISNSPFKRNAFYCNPKFEAYCKKHSNKLTTQNEFNNFFKENPDVVFAKNNGTKLYLGIAGNKDMFEYSFKKMKLNTVKFNNDLKAFRTTLDTIDQITKLK